MHPEASRAHFPSVVLQVGHFKNVPLNVHDVPQIPHLSYSGGVEGAAPFSPIAALGNEYGLFTRDSGKPSGTRLVFLREAENSDDSS